MLIRAIISLNGKEKEVTCNQNRLIELQHSGYVLERVIERVNHDPELGRKISSLGSNRQAHQVCGSDHENDNPLE